MRYYDEAIRQRTLAHHGILGQKWGVRRFQNKNGTLTPEGRRHKEKLESTKSEYKALKKKVNLYRAVGVYDENAENNLSKKKDEMVFRKTQVSNDKARSDIVNRDSISKREQSLINKYTKNGMSKEDAELKAYKQVKLEKTLIAAGAVTMAAATAYGFKKYHDYTTDTVLKAGKIQMKRVAQSDSTDLHDTFYAAFSKKDANKYIGLYGAQIRSAGAGDIYQKTIDIKENLKIASDKRAKETMANVFKNASNESKDEAIKLLEKNRLAFIAGGGVKQAGVITKAIGDIKKGSYNTKSVYDSMNMAMGDQNSKIIKDFKDSLKKNGYSGVKDRNDKSYSGYRADSARIIFDNSKVKVNSIRMVPNSEIDNKNISETMKILIRDTAKVSAVLVGGNKAAQYVKSKKTNDKIVSAYKKQHPDSKLSNEQILENYYGGK